MAMTLRLYADRKGWPLEQVTMELSHQRVHADDCEECEDDATGFVDLIRRYIQLHGALSEEQRTRLALIATRCPVHKTLLAKPQIIDEIDLVSSA